MGTNILGQSEPESNGNEGLLHILKYTGNIIFLHLFPPTCYTKLSF